jgi:membrane fusion protein (multidrug efflux system)
VRAGRCPALLAGFVAVFLLAGCNRNPAPAADVAKTAAAPAAPAKSAAVPAPGAGSVNATTANATTANATAAARKAADAEKDKARQAAAEQIPVEAAIVTRGPISAFLSFNSTLETEAQVDIYPQTTGQVETLFVEEGRIVKEGDPLLKIDDRELRVDVDESTANYDQLQKAFARMEDLFRRNLINRQDYETQSYQTEQGRLRLERAKIRLSYATVRAPFDGVIASRDTQLGARVSAGTKVFSMVKLDEIVARVFVPGRYLPVVAENQSATITSEFLPDRSFKGWVKRISPVIDPKSGTFKVTVGVKGEKPSDLPPGLFVGVRIITDTRDSAMLIPKRAVVYEGGERYVFTVVKDRAVKRKLVAGYEDPQNIEALSGFEVGSIVIVLGQSGLKDGAMVRVVNDPAAAAKPKIDAAQADVSPSSAPKPEKS